MAIWQFRIDLIPMSALRAKFGTVPISVPQDLAEDFDWWSDAQPPSGFKERLDSILPGAGSWSEEMLIWGDERGDTASVCFDDTHRVQWVGFRVDVRSISHSLIRKICALASDWGCMLMGSTYHLMAPNEKAVLAAIGRSTAKRYIENPIATLLGMKRTSGEVIQLPNKNKGDGDPPKR
ncbi:hypothetical protein ACLEPN_05755 [Myxococcus sp. 1LA]